MIEELPNSTRLEQNLLGSLLVFPQIISQCRDEDLQPEEFFQRVHQDIFRAILQLDEGGRPVDFTLLVEELQNQGLLENTVSLDYLSQLTDGAVSPALAGEYIEEIKNKAQIRRLITAADQIANSAGSSREEIDFILDDAERSIMEVTRRRRGSEFYTSREIVDRVYEEIRALQENRGVSGIKTGYTDFDSMTNGLHPGELLILAARPAMGKSALALNFANQVAFRNEGAVAIFSLEMPAESLMKRLLAAESQIDSKQISTGQLNEDEMNRLYEAGNNLSDRAIFIDDTSMIKVSQIFSKCRKLKSQFGSVSLIVIDYLQLISGSGRSDSRQQEVSEISRNLKILAKEMECPVLALSQLSRKVEERVNHEPQLSDLRESGSIEQDADIVMFLYRAGYYEDKGAEEENEEVELSIKKHRNGETGKISLCFQKAHSLFLGRSPRMDDPYGN